MWCVGPEGHQNWDLNLNQFFFFFQKFKNLQHTKTYVGKMYLHKLTPTLNCKLGHRIALNSVLTATLTLAWETWWSACCNSDIAVRAPLPPFAALFTLSPPRQRVLLEQKQKKKRQEPLMVQSNVDGRSRARRAKQSEEQAPLVESYLSSNSSTIYHGERQGGQRNNWVLAGLVGLAFAGVFSRFDPVWWLHSTASIQTLDSGVNISPCVCPLILVL